MTQERQDLLDQAPVEQLTAEELDTVSSATGGTGGGAGKVNVQDLSFTHHYDAASPILR